MFADALIVVQVSAGIGHHCLVGTWIGFAWCFEEGFLADAACAELSIREVERYLASSDLLKLNISYGEYWCVYCLIVVVRVVGPHLVKF